jgi:hypothetical protein
MFRSFWLRTAGLGTEVTADQDGGIAVPVLVMSFRDRI